MNEALEAERRALPDAPLAEQALLGLALYDAHAREVACALHSGAWTLTEAGVLMPLLTAQQLNGIAPSAVTLSETMRGTGWLPEEIERMLSPFVNVTEPASSSDHLAKVIASRHEARVAILKCEAMAQQIRQRPDEAGALLEVLVSDVLDVAVGPGKGFRQMAIPMGEAFDESVRRAQGDMTGAIVTGIPEFDATPIGGLEEGDLVTVVMTSGHGKTALLSLLGLRASMEGSGVAFVECEMTDRQIGRRMAAQLTGLPFGTIRSWSEMSTEHVQELAEAHAFTQRLPIWIDDTGTPSLAHVLNGARRLKRKHPALRLVCIDYMTLIQGTGNNFTEQYNTTVRALKKLAKELRVAVVGLVQPDAQTIERRSDSEQMPRLTDIAWCQEFRNQSDLIICGYRPGQSALRHLAPGATVDNEDRIGRFVLAKARNSTGAEWEWSWWGGGMAFAGGCWERYAQLRGDA